MSAPLAPIQPFILKAAQSTAGVWATWFLKSVGVSFLTRFAGSWLLRLLGFGVLGPIGGSFATWWMSFYGAATPARSLFSILQWLAMKVFV